MSMIPIATQLTSIELLIFWTESQIWRPTDLIEGFVDELHSAIDAVKESFEVWNKALVDRFGLQDSRYVSSSLTHVAGSTNLRVRLGGILFVDRQALDLLV